MSNKDIILIIRGHIRTTFDNDQFYNLIKDLKKIYNISIYIHTWNIQQSNISWREMEQMNNIITKEIIYSYFKDLRYLIKNIIIEDDTKIQLIGNLEGTIGTKCPLIGWKRYIYGLYQSINYVRHVCSDEFIVTMRFDILLNFCVVTKEQIFEFISNNYDKKFKKNVFLYNNLIYGLDNVFGGNIQVLYKLCKYFNENLDYIIFKNKFIINQEFLLFIENELIF
jgi:hypothetical protein